jgi:hypothetical protein
MAIVQTDEKGVNSLRFGTAPRHEALEGPGHTGSHVNSLSYALGYLSNGVKIAALVKLQD